MMTIIAIILSLDKSVLESVVETEWLDSHTVTYRNIRKLQVPTKWCTKDEYISIAWICTKSMNTDCSNQSESSDRKDQWGHICSPILGSVISLHLNCENFLAEK